MVQVNTYMVIEQQGDGRSKLIEMNYLSSAVINENIENLTDTCTITFPSKVSWKGVNISNLIKRGDKIHLFAGYDSRMHDVFQGYITSVSSRIPISIECENLMYGLKKYPVTKSYSTVNLQKLCEDIIPEGIIYKADDVQLGTFRTKNNPTIPKVFEGLKEYGLTAYYRNNILYVGKLFWTEYQQIHDFRFNYNIVQDNLDYRRKEDIKLKVKAVSINSNNSKIELNLGDDDGELRTLYYYNISANELKRRATAEIDKLKYDGLRGNFRAKGEPFVQKGDVAKITNPEKPEIDGMYLIKSVQRQISYNEGIVQIIELYSKYDN